MSAGGVISPLLWILTMDELLTKLKRQIPSLFIQAFADDLLIAQQGTSSDIICQRVLEGLRTTAMWCKGAGLELNPLKTEIIPFTKKRRLPLPTLKLHGAILHPKTKVRYLGITVDSKLTWLDHMALKTSKASAQFAMCRRIVGRKWGLDPRVMHWLYKSVIRPSLVYGAVVWAHKAQMPTRARRLERIQRSACLAITGAMCTTATQAMESIIGLLPLDIYVQGRALATWQRLQRDKKLYWSPLQTGRHSHLHWCNSQADRVPILKTSTDLLDHERSELGARGFKIETRPRHEWSTDLSLTVEGLICFTDGSKIGDKSGSGVLIQGRESIETVDLYETSIPLGSLATVFQTELHAIEHAAGWLLNNGYVDQHLHR